MTIDTILAEMLELICQSRDEDAISLWEREGIPLAAGMNLDQQRQASWILETVDPYVFAEHMSKPAYTPSST